MARKPRIIKSSLKRNLSTEFNPVIKGYRVPRNLPGDITEAYSRNPGPFSPANSWPVLSEEPLELYNGWLVWQEKTDFEERRIVSNIHSIISLAARRAGFGQAYPDQTEFLMENGDVYKPDLSLLSNEGFESRLKVVNGRWKHTILTGSPEIVIETFSQFNRNNLSPLKRQNYFNSGASFIWYVDYKGKKILEFQGITSGQPLEYNWDDEISCERFLPGWRRKVGDFFAKDLSAEEIAGEAAGQWRLETQTETLRGVLLLQARLKFGEAALPSDLAARLEPYTAAQLTGLVASITSAATLGEWLGGFPE